MNTVIDAAFRLTDLRRKLDAALAARRLALAQQGAERATLATAQAQTAAALEAQQTAQGVAAAVQSAAHKAIAEVVTRCLLAVFGPDAYTFEIRFESKRSKTEAVLLFKHGDLEIDPLSAAGGGVIDVAGFALRLAALMLARPKLRKIIVADEPFRFINGEDYQGRVAAMLATLAEDMGIQMILVSDDQWVIDAGQEIKIGE